MVALAAAAIASVWLGGTRPAVAISCAVVVGFAAWQPRRADVVLLAGLLAITGATLSARSWQHATPRHLGPYAGWVTLVADPVPFAGGVRVVLEVQGERFEAAVFGPERRRIAARQGGERLEVVGVRDRDNSRWARRSQVRHVVGRFELHDVGAHDPGATLARASNRVRGLLRSGAANALLPDQAALFTGLVIGDDVAQPPAMIEQFRSAGLSHLTAVSGQNVAFVLAAAGLGLRRLRSGWRLAATVALIAWFVIITRVEPSVLRAGLMAALSATAFAVGRDRTPVRTLGLSVIVLVLVDPMLVWSVAFWLSVCATFGVAGIGPALGRRLRGPTWLTVPLAVSLGAQAGVAVPSWLVFHRLPSLGVVANLLAVPVAGLVMLYGIPAGIVAGAMPSVADVVMLPCEIGTRWVATVAALAARFAPTGAAAAVLWALQLIVLAVWLIRSRPGTAVVRR